MKVEIYRDGSLPDQLADELVEFHWQVFSKQESAIALERTKEEVKALLVHPSTIVFVVQDEKGIVGMADLFPVADPEAGKLMPWVNAEFMNSRMHGLPYYISILAIRADRRALGYATKLMRSMKQWGESNGVRIVAFDSNTRYSAIVPLMAQRVTKWILIPGKLWAVLMLIAGKVGLDANPVWYLCRTKTEVDIVSSALRPKPMSLGRMGRIARAALL